MDGQTDGQMEGQACGQMDGYGWKEGGRESKNYERKE